MSRRIPQPFLSDLLARTDLVDLIGARVTLKRAGSSHKGLCPFHDEKTASFTVSADKGFYKCFGCGAYGNAIDFLMRYENREFLEAVVGRCSGISYTYRASAEAPPEGGPAVGDRAPDVDLGSGRTLYDLTRHPSCTLLALPARAERGAALETSLKGLVHRFAPVLELRVVAPSPALAERYGASDDDRLLVLRPDGYVGFRCTAGEIPALEARLHEWFAL